MMKDVLDTKFRHLKPELRETSDAFFLPGNGIVNKSCKFAKLFDAHSIYPFLILAFKELVHQLHTVVIRGCFIQVCARQSFQIFAAVQ